MRSDSKRDTRQTKTRQKKCGAGSVLSPWQPSHATHDTHQQAFVFQGSFLCMYQTGWETHTWFCLPSPLQFAQSALTLRCPLIEYGEPWDWRGQRQGEGAMRWQTTEQMQKNKLNKYKKKLRGLALISESGFKIACMIKKAIRTTYSNRESRKERTLHSSTSVEDHTPAKKCHITSL